jgi:hypothetical protein
MKFTIVEDFDLEEVYFTTKNRDIHHHKHVISDEDGKWKMEYMSPEEYNCLADELSSAHAEKLNNKEAKIIGYITKDGRIVKHNRETKMTVVYVDDDERGHEAISLYKQPTGKFFDKLNRPDTKMAFGKNLESC